MNNERHKLGLNSKKITKTHLRNNHAEEKMKIKLIKEKLKKWKILEY
jgi:hypothetical protein